MTNIVYIATSLDGFIADKNNQLDWLHDIPNPNHDDCGWSDFINKIDAIVMGRKTFETVCGFDCDWPYTKPVFVLSRQLNELPAEYTGKAELLQQHFPEDIINTLHARGYKNIYIDGGRTVQSFLSAGLVDEMVITKIPILLGGGTPLFGELNSPVKFKHVHTEVLLDDLVKTTYKKISAV